MKKILVLISMITLALIIFTGCSKYTERNAGHTDAEIAEQLKEDIQGFWVGSDGATILAFNGDEFMLTTLSNGKSNTGSYSLKADKLTLILDDTVLQTVSSLKVKNDVLSYTSQSGNKVSWEKISPYEVEDLMASYNY